MNIGNRSKTERALVATTASGRIVVLATDGEWTQNDVEQISDDTREIDLLDEKDCPTPGLYLWEGYGEIVNGGSWDCTEPIISYIGTVRPVRPEEIESLYKMKPKEKQ